MFLFTISTIRFALRQQNDSVVCLKLKTKLCCGENCCSNSNKLDVSDLELKDMFQASQINSTPVVVSKTVKITVKLPRFLFEQTTGG